MPYFGDVTNFLWIEGNIETSVHLQTGKTGANNHENIKDEDENSDFEKFWRGNHLLVKSLHIKGVSRVIYVCTWRDLLHWSTPTLAVAKALSTAR